MRIVIDASVDPRIVEAFAEHEVRTLFHLDWQNLKDNVLVKQLQCDAFVNKVTFYRPLYAQLLQAVESIKPGDVIHVGPLQPE